MTAKPKPHPITLVRSSHHPSKADMEEVIPPPRKPDGTRATPEELAKAALRPVNIKWKDRP